MGRRWWILAIAVAAQAAVTSLVYGLPFMLPQLRAELGLSLTEGGTLAVAPVLGVLVALIAWGAATDRFGERLVMGIGMAGTGLAGLAAASTTGVVGLVVLMIVAGVFSASITSASGRAVLGWFEASERGLAMGIRQTCTPIGVGFAALVLPAAGEAWGYRAALLVPAALCLALAIVVALWLVDPPRTAARTATETRSPYRTLTLWRVHTASALLVGPQFISSTFALTYLVTEHGWSAVTAGVVLAIVQIFGAAGRIGAGVWSDRVGSRMRPMRIIAVAVAAALMIWAFGGSSWVAVVGLVAVLVISVTDNGLAFTATAELAGPFWAGRALGIQNTGQNAMALAIAPLFAVVVTAFGWPLALSLAAALPLAAALITPVGQRLVSTR
ncbi:MFS transporter [Actinokineospora cianjurensis]|uniref:Sugar phosphate permease n=1 Tax=Actinokineospora cianjurensis TaxID=585224 RepID=A0A421B7H5_9PSEU|nr:MFS transporter [Actinokineospora cianjurensis]RLK60324.1 sugar phosphate permease [Actinokineospora cianjurensis]